MAQPQSSTRKILRAGALEVHLLPGSGGSIARFDATANGRRQALLRGTDSASASPLEAACFPLVPFANRVRECRFHFRAREFRLSPNMPPDPSPIHGQGWLAAWEVLVASTTEAVLEFVHDAGEWPWRYRATQHFALDPAGLSVVLSCRNLSEEPMPCALGLHPYFPCNGTTVFDATVTSVWTVDANVLPVRRVPATGRYDLRNRRICGIGLDNGFSGWDGAASIEWGAGSFALCMSSSDAAYLQVYAPEVGGMFAAEPVQSDNSALNDPEENWHKVGIRVLACGEECMLRVRFKLAAPRPSSSGK